jgi:Na+-translocating ferredoxin:NAD+ oxidoreductase subunit C
VLLPLVRGEDAPDPAPLPSRLILPLQTAAGDAARPLVSPGQRVRAGEALSEPLGLLSRVRRAPLSGLVAAVERRPLLAAPLGDGDPGAPATVDCIVLEDLEAPSSPATQAWRELDAAERARRLGAAGLSGAEGLPLDLELELLPPGATLVLRCAELQPGQRSIDWLLRQHAGEIAAAVESLLEPGRFAEAVLVHGEGQKESASRLAAHLEHHLPTRPVALREGYPWDHPRLLVHKASGRWADHARCLAAQGWLLLEPGRLLRLARRLSREDYGSPLLLSVCRVDSGRRGPVPAAPPRLLRLLPGMPLGEARIPLGARPGELLLFGGPFDGRPALDDELPLPEGLDTITLLPRGAWPVHREEACISCGQCLDICPVRLAPVRLVHLIAEGRLAEARALGLGECLDCGLCSWNCPSRIHLGHGLRDGLQQLREGRRER